MQRKIYIVTGETGYDMSHEWWLVAAYRDKDECNKHVKAANKVTRDFFQRNKQGGINEIPHKMTNQCENPYDPFMEMQVNGTHYFTTEVEVMEKFE